MVNRIREYLSKCLFECYRTLYFIIYIQIFIEYAILGILNEVNIL